MNNLLIAAFLLIISFGVVNAQKPTLPIDEKTGKTVYTEVIPVEGVSQNDLYYRALNWFKSYFTNPASVIKEQDAMSAKVSGQHGIYIFKDLDEKPFKVGQVRYTIEVLAKDGRYKYTVDDIFKLVSPKVYVEEWLDESSPDKVNQFGYARQVDAQIKELIEDLKKTMQAAPKEEKDDW